MYSYNPYYERYLAHYGVLGMHWGIRRYQPYTHGQKGIFKGLKKKKRADIKSLKKDLRAYKKQGNEAGINSVKSQIKDIKKNYKLDIADLKKQFRTENYNAYKEKVAQSGSYNQVDKIKKELTPEQLNMATNRLNAEAAFDASAVNHDKSIQKLKLKADKVNQIANIANAGIRVADAVRTVENMLGYDNKARKLSFEATASAALQRLKSAEGMNPKDLPNNLFSKRQMKALTDEYEHNKALKDKGTIEKNRISEETANVQKWKAAQELFKANKERTGSNNSDSSESNSEKTTQPQSTAEKTYNDIEPFSPKEKKGAAKAVQAVKVGKRENDTSYSNFENQQEKNRSDFVNTILKEDSYKKVDTSSDRVKKVFDFSSVDMSYASTPTEAKVSDLQKAYEATLAKSKAKGYSDAQAQSHANSVIRMKGKYSLAKIANYMDDDIVYQTPIKDI